MEPTPLQRIETQINGSTHALEVRPEAAALEVLREELLLTGAKLVCGAGVCGACTIEVDGQPANACLLPACSLDGKKVRTIEAWNRAPLHPVQRAFLAHDGLQCGYCTPGFIVEAIHFYDRWRADQGTAPPSRAQIAAALAGHLCRCGAYVGIYDAVRAACAGAFDDDNLDGPRGTQVDGEPFPAPRHDAEEKVTGRARYTTDIDEPGTLIGRFLGSPHAHAKVVAIDLEAARAVPGVHAILDVLDDPHRVVRYAGQPILAIAADDEEAAHAALQSIEIEYEVRPFVLDLDASMRPGAPQVYPEKHKHTPNASEGPIPPARWKGNLRHPYVNWFFRRRKGRVRAALAAARRGDDDLHLVEVTFRSPAQTHTALEPHACLARWHEGHLTVHTSTQSVHALAAEIRRRYRLTDDQLTLRSEYIGGAFGAKQGLLREHTAAIELARTANAPVRIVYDRAEELLFGGCRPATRIEMAVVATRDGGLRGIRCRAYGDPGVAVQSQVAPWIRFLYDGPKDAADIDVVTNTAPARPFRGPSGPPAFWALEQCVDQVAHDLGQDPIALRRAWDKSDVRHRLYDWAASIPEWRNRGAVGRDSGRFRRGIGLAIGNWFSVYHNATQVELAAESEGLVARCAVQDMGQGSRSVIAQAIAGEFGIDRHQVRVEIGDAAFPRGPVSSGSRTTPSIYPAAIDAARRLRRALREAATSRLGLKNPTWKDGGLTHATGHLHLPDLLAALAPLAVTSKKRGANGWLDVLGMLPSGQLGMSMFPKMTGSIALVAATVDTRLGRIHPEKVWTGLAAGKIVHRELADSQVYGAVIQSLGIALTEERCYDPTTGRLLSVGLDDYRIPGIGDVPEIEVHYEESGFEKLKGGAAGMSELATVAPPAALGNAIYHATGWRPNEMPMQPHRVLAGLRHLPPARSTAAPR